MKVFVVSWAVASQDDDGNCSAFGNVHGVYTNYVDARKGLTEFYNEFYNEIVNNPDFDEEETQDTSIQVYGSVEDGCFEIDYRSCDISKEIYIFLDEKELIEG